MNGTASTPDTASATPLTAAQGTQGTEGTSGSVAPSAPATPAASIAQSAPATPATPRPPWLIPVTSPEAKPHLRAITHLYTDLDGTLLAPGGKLLANHAGEPSTATAEAVVALKRAGLDVIIVTGRNGLQGYEFLRIFDLQTFIGEVGCLAIEGLGIPSRVTYELGDWEHTVLAPGLAPGELPAQTTPYRLISESGVTSRLLATFPGKLESPSYTANERQVTHVFRGFIDAEKAARLLATEHLPLELVDNGEIHPQEHTLIDCPEIHIYHLIPRGTSKAVAVARDLARRKLDAAQALAIGDSLSDVEMGEHTGTLVVMGNALRSETVQRGLAERVERAERTGRSIVTLYTEAHTADGWAEFAWALLAAQDQGSAG
ncbi:MAG: Cof-type HAD-IIB family hydrolase [Coriobacteriales bacterium]|jgi:hydroxymethylpyrimidine pyrophosphatase-like HAD family hydrolase|nr:Cof-type HAD-IIB family hydrolase [Coriobacteriales bacterium]